MSRRQRTFCGTKHPETGFPRRSLSATGFRILKNYQPPLCPPIFDGAVENAVVGHLITWVFRGSQHTLEGLDVMICDGKTLDEVIDAMPNADPQDVERVYWERKRVIDGPQTEGVDVQRAA